MKTFDNEIFENYFNSRYDEPFSAGGKRSFGNESGEFGEYLRDAGLNDLTESKCAVLGIDIYRYSLFAEETQTSVPYVFHLLAMRAFNVCLMTEPFLFQKYRKGSFDESFEYFLKDYVDTGDGGFFIFETPLHAFIYAILFESMIRNYNTQRIFPKAGGLTQEILLRYALTYDTVYRYIDKKFPKLSNTYGTGLINCSRVLAKDKLNRCLIDENTYRWFIANTNGVESLRTMPFTALKSSDAFHGYEFGGENRSFCLPETRTLENRGIDRLDILKIGEIKSKNNIISVYNLHAQLPYRLPFFPKAGEDVQHFVVTLGNLNIIGISEE